MRKNHALAVLLGFSLVAASCAARASPAAVKPDPGKEACDGEDPQACLARHAAVAARRLTKIFSDANGTLDAACSEVISPGIAACLEQAQAIADGALNEAYKHALGSIPNTGDGRKWRERLKLSQEAWLRFRDADCGDLVISETGTGSGMGAALLACQLGKTESRTAELAQRYSR